MAQAAVHIPQAQATQGAGEQQTGCATVQRKAYPGPVRWDRSTRWELATIESPRRLTVEVWLVLGLSLGRSGVYAILDLVNSLTYTAPLGDQSTTLHQDRQVPDALNLAYQLAPIVFGVFPALLAIYLLGRPAAKVLSGIGLDATRPRRDGAHSVVLAAAIGLPGLAFYIAGRVMGITKHVVASGLAAHWWTIPVLVASAIENGLLEEVVAVAYLVTRLEQLRWRPWAVLGASAALRGCYHLYQGIGPALANIAMGLVFAEYYRRTRRVAPLVGAHILLDVVSFVGQGLLPDGWLP
ncbi:MAG: CPBP family intramembrane metalloprotease [Bifidobacteriaceae bacterium]|nr:CPBP family intramembrane metalloprotease [Bifidobacteriaceae bacterium]